MKNSLSHRNSITYLRSHTRVTLSTAVSPHRDLSPALFRTRVQDEEAALYRLRRNYAISGEISSRDMRKNRAKSVKLLPNSDSRPVTPYLGVNFRQSSSEVTWKSHFSPPLDPSRSRRLSKVLPEPKGNRISLVKIGLDLCNFTLEKPKRQEQALLAWANMQNKLSKREERAKTPNPRPVLVVPKLIPVPTPVITKVHREIQPEDLSDVLIPLNSERTKGEKVQRHILHISSQPQAGFLHMKEQTSSKFPLQQPKVKRRNAKSVQRHALAKQITFDLPVAELSRELESDRRPERVTGLRGPFIPKGTPLYRIPVDYNLFRNVYKHRERPPRTSGSRSSPNLRESAKDM
jgi:hypothetical protein